MLPSPTAVDTPKGAAGPGQRKPRKPRGRGLRTTTGCAICRRRHMKCDEQKPVCGPCAKGNRECVYGHAKSPSSAVSATSDAEQQSQTGRSRPHQGINGWHQQALPVHGSRPLDGSAVGMRPTIDTNGYSYTGMPVTAQSCYFPDQRRSPGSEPDLAQLPWNQPAYDSHSTTPVSSFGGAGDPYRWFGMLTEDGMPVDDDFAQRRAELIKRQNSCASSPSLVSIPDSTSNGYSTPSIPGLHSPLFSLAPPLMPSLVPRSCVPTGDERELWQAPITLNDNEMFLFRVFIDELSLWLDLFDPMKHFSTLVPQLALSNEGLMKAILALSARHLSIKPKACQAVPTERNEAVQYYSETLQYLQRAMKFESYTRSPDIIATSLIVSAYEMIDGAGKSWERHLKGVFWIQRSQDNDGESGGLRQAVWWAWLRQDMWAAYRERRRCFTIWKPRKAYARMDQYEIACRVIFLLCQAVNYASEEEQQQRQVNPQAGVDKADRLFSLLEEWKRHLTVHFQPLPVKSAEENGAFKPILINPPAFGAAMQMYNCAKILLLVNRPTPASVAELSGSFYHARNTAIAEAIDQIGGIACTISDQAASIISTQALYCAGQYALDLSKQQAIARLLDEHVERTGWPIMMLADELRMEWNCAGNSGLYPTPPEEDVLPSQQYFGYSDVNMDMKMRT